MFKVKIENLKQLDIALSFKNVSEIILSRDSFAECDLPKFVDKIKKSGKIAWILMERISRYEENMKSPGANFRSPRTGELSEPASMDLRTSTDKIYEIKNLDGIIIQNIDSFAYMYPYLWYIGLVINGMISGSAYKDTEVKKERKNND